MASRWFRCKNMRKENPLKSKTYKGVSGESRCGTHECVMPHTFHETVARPSGSRIETRLDACRSERIEFYGKSIETSN